METLGTPRNAMRRTKGIGSYPPFNLCHFRHPFIPPDRAGHDAPISWNLNLEIIHSASWRSASLLYPKSRRQTPKCCGQNCFAIGVEGSSSGWGGIVPVFQKDGRGLKLKKYHTRTSDGKHTEEYWIRSIRGSAFIPSRNQSKAQLNYYYLH